MPNIAAAGLDNNQAIAGSTAGQVVGARRGRRSVTLRNTHGTDSCYIGQSGVSATNGFLLKAGESISIETTAAIHALRGSSNNITICYLEVFE